MTKVYCASLDCEFHGNDNRCYAREINLADQSIMTLWNGRQRFNTCRTWQESQLSIDMKEALKPFYEKWKMNKEDKS